MEHHVAVVAGGLHGLGIGDVALGAVDAHGLEVGVGAAPEHAHLVAALAQLAGQGRAQEAAAAGDERPHSSRRAAHTASASRSIFAL